MVEQPIRNRQVVGSTPTLGSIIPMSAMTRYSQSRIETSGTCKRTAVCLVLVALLLYNPFFTILSCSQDLSVSHPLSYRATVAGSELRRCTVDPANPLIPELTVALLHAAILLTPTHEVAFVQPSDTAGPVSQASCDSIWFRPPPSA